MPTPPSELEESFWARKMGAWLLGLWRILSAIFGMMLDVAQFWELVSVLSWRRASSAVCAGVLGLGFPTSDTVPRLQAASPSEGKRKD